MEAKSSAPPAERERRSIVRDVELRAAKDGDPSPGTVVGYAAVFNSLSLDLGYFREKIAPGAFAEVLKTADVRALRNHDDDDLLGRMKSGTLRLAEDEIGLRYEIDLPDTTVGRDTAVMIGRGDMSGSSFGFEVDVDEWDWSGQTPIRTVRNVSVLYDVGPVTFPAYDASTAAVRSYSSALEKRNAAKAADTAQAAAEHDARVKQEQNRLRLRLAESS